MNHRHIGRLAGVVVAAAVLVGAAGAWAADAAIE